MKKFTKQKNKKTRITTYAFIDSQNLNLGVMILKNIFKNVILKDIACKVEHLALTYLHIAVVQGKNKRIVSALVLGVAGSSIINSALKSSLLKEGGFFNG